MTKVAVIGSGFSSLANAAYLAKAGYDVHLFEKNDTIGGRCRQYKVDGFTFDMGPSWYWMPEIFEGFFNDFGKKVSDYYELIRLSPSYSVQYDKNRYDISSNLDELKEMFESIEPGSAKKLQLFLDDAEEKYATGIGKFVHKPSLSILEFAKFDILKGFLQLDLFKAFSKHVRNYFSDPRLIQLLEFPVLFLGATPKEIPALYSLMNYADIVGGTWYPMKGMFGIIEGMEDVCKTNGVEFHLSSPVSRILVDSKSKKATGITVNGINLDFDVVVAGADYHHVEQKLIGEKWRNYGENYWETRKLAPSALIFYLGVNKRLKNLKHHNLYFDTDFDQHSSEIYDSKTWPKEPLFYVCAPSITDPSVAPEGKENLFILIPIAPGIKDTEEEREIIFSKVIARLEKHTDQEILGHIIYKHSYAKNDFQNDYNAFKGNAYGLANTLRQTAFMKPTIRNKKLNNVYYTGQLTVPGPGVPPSIISGKVVADEIIKHTKP